MPQWRGAERSLSCRNLDTSSACALSDCYTNSHSHQDTAIKIEAAARKALLASNTSHEHLWHLLRGKEASEARRELEDR